MEKDDWPQLKALFQTAIDQPEADRAAFLARAYREHPRLEAQLRALMASHSDAPDFLEQPAYANVALGTGLEASGSEPDSSDLLSAGDVLDQTYEVEAMLGQGGMGVVYRVRHRALARSFAAKLIHSRFADDPRFLERFTREAEALGKLKHPHIVDVTDFGVDRATGARPYLILEYLEGQTLQERLVSGPLEPDAALPVFDAVAAAIDHAHEQGVLHLDLKPGNVLLVYGPDGQTSPKILDFGLAQFMTSESSGSSDAPAAQSIGTPAYMAPELWDGGRPGRSADIYSLGVLMHEALTGQRPIEGSVVGRDLDSALATALAGDPSLRPPTAGAAVALVRRAVLAATQQRWRRKEVPRRVGAAAVLAVVGMLLSLLLGGAAQLQKLEGPTIDARFALTPKRAPGPNILLLLLDEASLDVDATPIALRADQFGVDLQRVFDAGARAVAVDFPLPESWSRSEPFRLLVLHNPERLTLAATSTAAGEISGPEAIKGVTTVSLGPQRAAALFGIINLDEDADGINRRARLSYRDREAGTRPSFAARAVSTARAIDQGERSSAGREGFWIDHRTNGSQFDRVSWKDLDTTLGSRPELFRDRLVLVGGTYRDSGDEVRVPAGVVAGVVLHALIAETIFSRFPLQGVGNGAAAAGSGIAAGLLCAAILLMTSAFRAGLLVVVAFAGHALGAFLAFRLSGLVLPIVAPLLAGALCAALARWLRQRWPAFPTA